MNLIPEASAQAAEATKAAVDAADMLLQYRVLGAACVFLILALCVAGLVIRHQYNDLKALNKEYNDFSREAVKAIEAGRAADESVSDTLQALRGAFEARVQAIADLSHQFDKTATETRHGFANLSHATAGVLELVRDIRSAITGFLTRRGGDA